MSKLPKKKQRVNSFLQSAYQKLFKHFGPQHWWPGETPFEIIVGAILTQNTNWGNVEKAIRNLKHEKVLTPQALHQISQSKLAALIKPAGYFNVKAKRLKNFIDYLFAEYDGSLAKMKREKLSTLRLKLLTINGIGPETADSILLYAFAKPTFVVDAYTKRLLYRHNIIEHDATYHDVKDLFETFFKHDSKFFNEYHALIVRLGKDYCKTKALCQLCPLNDLEYSLIRKCPDCHRALTHSSLSHSCAKK